MLLSYCNTKAKGWMGRTHIKNVFFLFIINLNEQIETLKNKKIKINLAKKFYEKFKKNNYDQKINWLENIYKIKIKNELKNIKNKK